MEMIVKQLLLVLLHLMVFMSNSETNGQALYEVAVIFDPPVNGNRTFEYPVGADVTLTCSVTPSPSPSSINETRWYCSTGCAVEIHAEQSFTIVDLDLTDSGELNCSVIIDSIVYTSESVWLWVAEPVISCQIHPDEIEPFLIFANIDSIGKINIDGTGYHTLISGLRNGVAIYYDYYADRMYWTDADDGHIKTAPLSTGYPIITLVSELGIPGGLAIDWINKKMYWTDTGTNTLEQSDLFGYSRRILVNDTDEPRGIALDPMNDILYMTDWGSNPRIEKMRLDGSERETIITQDLVWPNTVTIDYFEPALYWADAWTDTIARGDLNGNNVVILLHDEGAYHPFGLTQFGDHLYWSDWRLTSIERISKHTAGLDRARVTDGLSIRRPSGIHVVHPYAQNVKCLPDSVSIITRTEMCLTNFVVLSWDSVTTASMSAPVSYDITISPSDGVTMMRITNTSYNITELTPATNYTVTVTSRNDVGVGEEAVIMFHIPTVAEAVPKGVTYLTNTTYESNLMIVTWDPAVSPYCGGVSHYQMIISSDDNDTKMDYIVNATCLTATFLNLRRSTTYIITVAGVNDAGVGTAVSIIVSTAIGNDSDTQLHKSGEEDTELSMATVITISTAATFFVTLIVTTLIIITITSLYYRYRYELRRKIREYDVTSESNQFVLAERDQDDVSIENPVYDTIQINHIKVESNPAYATLK